MHPVNLAYEAATADLNDVNMIDPFHLDAYGETTVNYNRDVEIYPVLNVKRPKDPQRHWSFTTAPSLPEKHLTSWQFPKLQGCQVHTSVMVSSVDIRQFKKLSI